MMEDEMERQPEMGVDGGTYSERKMKRREREEKRRKEGEKEKMEAKRRKPDGGSRDRARKERAGDDFTVMGFCL